MRALRTTLPASFALLALAAPASAHEVNASPNAKIPTRDFVKVRALGLAKRTASGLLRVKVAGTGRTVVTHGADPETREAKASLAADGVGERQPVCASDYYQHILYGYPADGVSRLAVVRDQILAAVRRMDALLNAEALASGGKSADYKVKCDGAGQIRIDAFQSSESGAGTSFAGVLSAAQRAGFNDPNADYTIFFDTSAPNACGTATYSEDEQPGAENANNYGGGYAVTYSDCWSGLSPMHENGHNQGAVQYSAPYSTGTGGHCDDGFDVMCYSDGGDRDAGVTIFCGDGAHFDCRHDTYFNTNPPAGSYLASHWNIGSPANRFVAFGPGGAGAGTGTSPGAHGARVNGREPGLREARRYARRQVRRVSPHARRIRIRCARRSAHSFRCRAVWRSGRMRYRARMVTWYRAGNTSYRWHSRGRAKGIVRRGVARRVRTLRWR